MDVRASWIQPEYRSTAKKVDQDLGFSDGQGPTTRKLGQFFPVLDLVFGAYEETSEGVKSLLNILVEDGMKKLGLVKETQAVGKDTAWIKGYLRQRLSSASVKANVSCLLERLV